MWQPMHSRRMICLPGPGGSSCAQPGKAASKKVRRSKFMFAAQQLWWSSPYLTLSYSTVPPPYPDLLASGNVVARSATPLASVAVGVAVRKGAPKPEISNAEAVRRMLLAAKSISYPNAAGGAAAGVSFNETLKKLGVAEQMQPKLKPAQGGAGAMAMVAKGEVEIGLTFLSEMDEPGIDPVGPLPRQISAPTSLVGFVSSHAKDPAA